MSPCKPDLLLIFLLALWGAGSLRGQQAAAPPKSEALAHLSEECQRRWQRDSLWARQMGWPLQWGPASFAGRQGQMPRYQIASGGAEIQSFYGQQLWAAPYNLRGQGQIIGQWESPEQGQTAPDTNHSNLSAATIQLRNASGVSSHATTVALHLIGQAQTDSLSGLGLAPEAQLEVWNNSQVEAQLASEVSRYYVSNHSYANFRGWISPLSLSLNGQTEAINWWSEANVDRSEDYGFGRYERRDSVWDAISYHAALHSIVVAAGNERGDIRQDDTICSFYYDPQVPGNYRFEKYLSPRPEADGGSDGYDCLVPGAVSKNAWVIGACNNIAGGYQNQNDEQILARSAFGPTDDGRVKPDFVAPGSATSFAAAQVSGSLTLLQELALKERGQALRSASLKALLMHTAFDFAPPGPDYQSGWGLINPGAAAAIIAERNSSARFWEADLAPQAEQVYYLYLDTNSTSVSASLAWTDPPGQPLNRHYDQKDLNRRDPLLINDLDLRLYQLDSGLQYLPFVLDPNQPQALAQPGDNVRDNAEQIVLTSAPPGWYALVISAKAGLVNDQQQAAPQAYSLVVSGFSRYPCRDALAYSARWDGQHWHPAAPSAGAGVRLSATYSLNEAQNWGELSIDPGLSLDLRQNNLRLSGHLSVPQGQIKGGEVIFEAAQEQEFCGQCELENIRLDNPGGLRISDQNSRLGLSGNAILSQGRLYTGDALFLRAGPGPRDYAQIHPEAGADWQGKLHYEFYWPAPSASGWRSLASPVSTRLGAFLRPLENYALSAQGSVFAWDPRHSRWQVPADTSAPFDGAHSYWIFLGESELARFNSFPLRLSLFGESPSTVQQSLGYHNGQGGQFVGASIDSAGWNLLANPFPENLNWSAVLQHPDFQPSDSSSLHGSYYVWDPVSNRYLSHNGSLGDSLLGGSIAPTQAFFVKLNRASDTLSDAFDFDRRHRHLARADQRKKGPPHWQLSLSLKGQGQDRCYVAWEPRAALSFDSRFDAYKLMGTIPQGPRLYTLPAVGQPPVPLSIQSLPEPQSEIKIALALRAPAPGRAQIHAQAIGLENPQSWYLVDRLKGRVEALAGSRYEFDYQPQDPPERFWLWRAPDGFQLKDGLAEQRHWWRWDAGRLHFYRSRWAESMNLRLYNPAGQLIWERQGLNGLQWSFELNLAAGLYYLQIEAEGKAEGEALYLGRP